MKHDKSVCIVAANPNPYSLTLTAARHTQNSLISQNLSVQFIYLDELKFDPVLSLEEIKRRTSFDSLVIQQQKLVSKASVLAFFYPDWWGYPPAILIGWVQKIFGPNVAFSYEGEDFMPKQRKPLLTQLKILMAVSSDERDSADVETSCETFKTRVMEHAGVPQVRYNVLSNSRNSNTQEKNLWMSRSVSIIQSWI